MTAIYRVIALHGFLGSPSDWEPLRGFVPEARWEVLDLWELFGGTAVSGWPSIGEALSARLLTLIDHDASPTFLLAYSFGARLALAVPWLGSNSSPLAGTCLVSCHPGLADGDDGARAARRAADEAWATRFIEAPVATIWKEWDAQTVFAGTMVPRRENRLPAPRVALAQAMRTASLGTQPDRRQRLREWCGPLLWVTGARDVKFRSIAAALEADGVPGAFVACERAGHRAPWDNPGAFAEAFRRWAGKAPGE